MNFYKHHIGDYAQATSHLSFVEDAAYSRLIRKYYAEEKPLPADLKAVQRLVGARTREEKNAVVSVLEEFFSLEADGWRNKRCDEELAQWKAQAETNRRIAAEREARKSKKTVKNSETDRPRNENESSNESLNESSTSTSGEREPNQNPESRIQNPIKTSLASVGVNNPPENCEARTGKFPMRLDWKPDPEILAAACMRAGALPSIVTPEALADFAGYWSCESAVFTEGQWVQKLIPSAKKFAYRNPEPAPPEQSEADRMQSLIDAGIAAVEAMKR